MSHHPQGHCVNVGKASATHLDNSWTTLKRFFLYKRSYDFMISGFLKLAIFCVNDVDFACPVTVLHIKFKSELRISEVHIPLITFYWWFFCSFSSFPEMKCQKLYSIPRHNAKLWTTLLKLSNEQMTASCKYWCFDETLSSTLNS